jgi:hypothetical protein
LHQKIVCASADSEPRVQAVDFGPSDVDCVPAHPFSETLWQANNMDVGLVDTAAVRAADMPRPVFKENRVARYASD